MSKSSRKKLKKKKYVYRLSLCYSMYTVNCTMYSMSAWCKTARIRIAHMLLALSQLPRKTWPLIRLLHMGRTCWVGVACPAQPIAERGMWCKTGFQETGPDSNNTVQYCTPFWRRPFRPKGILSGDLGGPKYFYSSVRLFFIFVQVLKRNDWSGTLFEYQSLDYKSKIISIVRAAKYKHEQTSRTRPWRDPKGSSHGQYQAVWFQKPILYH